MPQYEEIGLALDLENWDQMNQTFRKIGRDIDNVGNAAFDQVIEDAKLNWLSPVVSFVELATTYPNATIGDTAQTLDDDKVYRFNGTEWLFIQKFGQGPTTDIINKVNTIPLDQTKIEGQRNFHEFHKLHKYEGGNMQYSLKGDRYFDFLIPIGKDEYTKVVFQKDTNDDFIKLRNFSMLATELAATFKDYGPVTAGVMNTAGGANHYTITNGTTLVTSFTGTGIDMFHYYDTRGGLWRVEIDGVFIKNISTHIAAVPPADIYNSSAQYALRQIARNLVNTTHELKLIYQGADPANPATSDGTAPTTARGWIRYNLASTTLNPTSFYTYANGLVEKIVLLNNSSNKEFAFNVKPEGTAFPGQWFPEHNNIGTAFVGATGYQKLFIDGVEITSYAVTSYLNFTSAKLVQVLDMKHPDDPQPLARMTMVTTINRDGVHIDTTFDFLKNSQIAAGYVNMLPAEGAFARQFTTALGKNFTSTAADDSFKDMNEGDRSFSYMVTGESANVDYYAGMSHRNVIETMRLGQTGRKNGNTMVGSTWLQHRANGLQKLYPQVFADNYVMPAGSTYRFSGSFFAGKVQAARKLITAL